MLKVQAWFIFDGTVELDRKPHTAGNPVNYQIHQYVSMQLNQSMVKA